MTNKYIKRSRISEAKFRELIKYFSLDLDAHQIAHLTGLNRNTVNRYFQLIRQRIAELCEQSSPYSVTIEEDESYFEDMYITGKGRRSAFGNNPVFGILQVEGNVYTEVVPECARKTMQAIIRGRLSPDDIIHDYTWRGYNGLVDAGFKKYYSIHYGNNKGKRHMSGIESFWSYLKRRLMKFHGVPKSTFYFHLKECEFRYNYRSQEIYHILLKNLRENPLNKNISQQ